MKIFELRTYTLHVGKLSSAIKIYEELGWPALKKYKDNIIRYYIGDVGALNQIIHIWQFGDDNSRRKLWKTIYNDKNFIKKFSKNMSFNSKNNKFELDQYRLNLEKNIISQILQDINLYLRNLENDL